jgi:hypothetical protein
MMVPGLNWENDLWGRNWPKWSGYFVNQQDDLIQGANFEKPFCL